MNNQIKILNKLYELDEEIGLVSHINFSDSWHRTVYLSEDYNPKREYNHRTILDNEVVIEFDEKDEALNRELADLTTQKMSSFNIAWSKWKSGNKSTHIHFFIEPKEAKRMEVLKRVTMKYFGTHELRGTLYKPDFRLASGNHLIRLEYGIHENTGRRKTPISTNPNYPAKADLCEAIWNDYVYEVRTLMRRKTSTLLSDITDHPGFKYILATHEFKEVDDGRERALFMLIHTLKEKYKEDKEGFIDYLTEWYRYSGGRKLRRQDIANKVRYHWNKEYTITETYLNNLLYELGKETLISHTTPTN